MKERLLGAAVLVLIAVLVIPMLLNGPGEDQTEVTRVLELPAPESPPARTHVVELDAADSSAARATTPEATGPGAQTVTSVPGQPVDAPQGGAQTAAPQTASPLPRPRPAPAQPSDTQPTGWAVQVGSFTSESNARRLEGLLQKANYPVFVTRSVVQGRVVYRVRVGPEPERAGAEALAERLREDRQTTQIVEHP